VAGVDPVRRRRVRSAAWRIARTANTSGEIVGTDLAKMALARALWLQRQTRRAFRVSLEAGVAGCYCAVVPEAAPRFEAAMGHSIRTLMSDVLSDVVTPERLGELMREEFGKGREPLVGEMASSIEATGGPAMLGDLNRQFYGPLSNLYLHSSPTALVRQVGMRSNRVKRAATPMWSARSAVNLSDAMVALVARQLVEADRPEAELLDEYFARHYSRSLPPQTYLVLRLLLAKVSVRAIRDGVALLRRAAALSADHPVDSAQLDQIYADATAMFGGEESQVVKTLIAEAKAAVSAPP
jgi:hypothetical protein